MKLFNWLRPEKTVNSCLVSFPKSGRTWLYRMMRDELPLDRSHAGSSHMQAQHLDTLTTDLIDDYDRIVVLIRDPRDTAVSGYHWSRTRVTPQYTGTMSEFLRDPCRGIEKVARFNILWANTEGPLIVKYEELMADTPGTLRRIFDFLGHETSDKAIGTVIETHSFDAMRQHEIDKFKKNGVDADPNALLARKAKVGGYKNEMSEEDIAYCNEVLDRLDYFSRV